MRGLNCITIMGNLGVDPAISYTPTGRAVTHMRVAVNRRWHNAEGEPQERTEWFRVVVWGRQAEICNQYLAKGSPVYVQGRIETSSFEGSDGATRYVTELVAQDVIILPQGRAIGQNIETEEA